MRFILRDSVSLAGNAQNEDRFGHTGGHAWIIDGATDVLDEPLTDWPSDAGWFAEAVQSALYRHVAPSPDVALEQILARVTSDVATAFEAAARRTIAEPHEQPSAAGIITQLADGRLDALSFGDCTLLALPSRHGETAPTDARNADVVDVFQPEGRPDADASVRAAAERARHARPGAAQTGQGGIRAELMPMLRQKRSMLNREDGYGVLSITLPPARFIQRAERAVAPGDRFLFATDGFLRSVDIYGLMALEELGARVLRDGLAALANDLRAFEQSDLECRRFPRAKAMDDATAMLLEVAP